MNEASHNIIGLILAGGQGQRLGGLDKGLQEYKGRPLIEYVIASLKPQTDNLIISVNRNHSAYQQYDFDLVSDADDDGIGKAPGALQNPLQESLETPFQGPLAGLIAAIPLIKNCQQDYVLLSSCDSPNLPVDYALKLKHALTSSTAIGAVVHDGKRRQNIHCLLHTEVLTSSKATKSIQNFYQQGGRALYRWFEQNEIIDVDFSTQANRFLNINTLKQLNS